MASDLLTEMHAHMAEPFPESIEKGTDYGEVEPVLIGADIYGWATQAGALSPDDRNRLAVAKDELARSIPAFPADARPYYQRLLRIADLTLSA